MAIGFRFRYLVRDFNINLNAMFYIFLEKISIIIKYYNFKLIKNVNLMFFQFEKNDYSTIFNYIRNYNKYMIYF